MAVWTVFEPEEAETRRSTPQWADGFVFVPERLSWSALLLAPLVLLRHRLWLAFVGYALLQAAVILAVSVLDLPDRALVLLLAGNIAVSVGLPGLRRSKLLAQGYEEAGCVVAPKLDAAEQRYFDARLGDVAAPRPFLPPMGGARAPAGARPAEAGVLGLFPEASR
ncbi:DUF2628 domain-containing protein [Ancylobacter polymorphus]|uniref:DUF2628 domain-containing protein n=1 Tax=Ancylobacter polymorphus TaxID=223390 RepID=A0A9E6ZV09_9HYPH|nr:DUF2628 domain-containing protein [Ancylobacter polymorphus]UOK72224.1 DUF2628 domain-containing protein [Ancylobacter polymorphus]